MISGRADDEEPGLPWGIHTLWSIYDRGVQTGLPDGRWVFAVAEPCRWSRARAAWWVLTGRAYALRWPVAGELEDVLGITRLRRPPGGLGSQQYAAMAEYREQQRRGET